jgi:hypothetical protein
MGVHLFDVKELTLSSGDGTAVIRPALQYLPTPTMLGFTVGGEAVRKEISKRCILFGLVSCLGAFPVGARVGRSPGPSVTVAVHNHAGVSRNTLLQAEGTASEIFKQAGLDVDWENCDLSAEARQTASSCSLAEFPRHLQLSITGRAKDLTESVLGISFLAEDGSGCYSDVFFERVEELHERFHVNLGPLLGDVLAHEIAHLLLGTNAHSDTGIMRPHWNERDLVNASKGQLFFSQAQGRTMREKVAASLCRKERALVAGGSARD